MPSTPLRLALLLRPNVPAGVLVTTAVSTVVFAATPFLIPGVAVDQHVDVAAVGLISTAQLGGFTLASFGAGRLLRPRRRLMVAAVVLGLIANLASAFVPWFSLLVAIRFASGVSLGLIAWIAWAQVFGDDERVGDIAVIGPLVGTVTAPVIALVIDRSGSDAAFLLLAALHLVPLPFIRETRLADSPAPGRRHRPTRAAVAILAALGLSTFGGSAVFVFAGVIGQELAGMEPLTVALVFSLNALASIPAARYRGTRRLPGLWMGLTGVGAIVIGVVHHPVAFWIALPIWGFAFWMAAPGAFALLAERSRHPAERAGDAQAIMAAGRVLGPVLGGAMYATSAEALGIVAGAIMLVSSVVLVYVEWRLHPEVLTELGDRMSEVNPVHRSE